MTQAQKITSKMKGTWHGTYGQVRCPAHDDHTPSLSVSDGVDGRLLAYCHAGCSFPAVRRALRELGLLDGSDDSLPSLSSPALTPRDIDGRPEDRTRTEQALKLWNRGQSIVGTPVPAYLARRGLVLPEGAPIRFHAALRHPSGGTWAGKLALVTRGTDGAPLGVHRTFLTRDGSGKAPVSPAKMMLGPCKAGVVRLSEPGPVLLLGEGVETCLAAMQLFGQPAWAALSTSGLRTVTLPASVREVVVLADRDEPGEAAAQASARRLRTEGRRIHIERPLWGKDFNDDLLHEASRIGTGA